MKSHLHIYLLALVSVAGLSSCMNRSVLPSYYTRAGNHHIVAILPVQTQMIGMDAWLEQVDSSTLELIQENLTESVYVSVLKRSGLRERDIKIAFQSPKVTMARLKAQQVDPLRLMDEDPVELARIAGVDVIVLIRVRTDGGLDRYISASEKPIIYDEIEEEGDDDRPFFQKYEHYRTYLQAQLVDGYDGSLLFHFDKRKSTQIDIPLAEAVEDLSRSMVRQFPYKNMEGVGGKRDPIFVVN